MHTYWLIIKQINENSEAILVNRKTEVIKGYSNGYHILFISELFWFYMCSNENSYSIEAVANANDFYSSP